MKRIKKMKKWQILLSVFVILVLCLIPVAIWGNTAIQVTDYTIHSGDLPESFDGFRIAQVSDLHNTEFGENNEKLLSLIQNSGPDIIVITGDLIDSRRTDIEVAIRFVEEAVKIAPVYYVPGNHECRIDFTSFYAQLKAAGATLLLDRGVPIVRGEEHIYLMGIIDKNFYVDRTTEGALSSMIHDDVDFNLLLSHRPEHFDSFAYYGVDLALTGHTHGGQIRLPFIGGLYSQGFFPKYDAGLFVSGQTNMIISRGLGNSLFPLRINNRPELVIVTLKSRK